MKALPANAMASHNQMLRIAAEILVLMRTPDGWTRLANAHGMSADGKTIVGEGIRNGKTEAFVAVVPEPLPPPTMTEPSAVIAVVSL
jgi:hypothetical protein